MARIGRLLARSGMLAFARALAACGGGQDDGATGGANALSGEGSGAPAAPSAHASGSWDGIWTRVRDDGKTAGGDAAIAMSYRISVPGEDVGVAADGFQTSMMGRTSSRKRRSGATSELTRVVA